MHFQLTFSVFCARYEQLCLTAAIMCKYLNGLLQYFEWHFAIVQLQHNVFYLFLYTS